MSVSAVFIGYFPSQLQWRTMLMSYLEKEVLKDGKVRTVSECQEEFEDAIKSRCVENDVVSFLNEVYAQRIGLKDFIAWFERVELTNESGDVIKSTVGLGYEILTGDLSPVPDKECLSIDFDFLTDVFKKSQHCKSLEKIGKMFRLGPLQLGLNMWK
jgi:hypothetical protein